MKNQTITITILVILWSLLTGCGNQTITPTAANVISAAAPTATESQTAMPSLAPTVQPPVIHQTKIEIVTADAATGNGGNSWGGHQTRIVHTQEGIFTAYTVTGDGEFSHDWRLAERQLDGTWVVIAKGKAGLQPVNLLASPDGTLHVIGWPSGVGTMWSGKPVDGTITMTSETIPNVATGNYPYSSAGTDAAGDLCILSSVGGEAPVGWFKWACFIPSKNKWITQTDKLDYRYAYTYLFPNPNGQLSLVATRDVLWGALGYQQPPDEFEYVFNAIQYWRTPDVATTSIQSLSFAEEIPTNEYPYVYLDAQMDAYLDTLDRMHILYWRQGATTKGDKQVRHRIVSASGEVLYDGELPRTVGTYSRIFQDKQGRYFLLSSSGLLFPMDKDGIGLYKPIVLDLSGYKVEYSGFALSVPRTGSPLRDVMDVVFPSSDGTAWLYFQLDLSQFSADHEVAFSQALDVSKLLPASNPLNKVLANAQILFDANLDTLALPGWAGSSGDPSAITSQNGILIFKGVESNGPQIRGAYGLRENEACLVLFRYSGENPDFQIKATSGSWPDTWMEWGIVVGTDASTPGAHLQAYYPNYGWSLGLKDQANRWYYALLWVQGPTTFHVAAWEKDNSRVFAEQQLQLQDVENWGNRRWQCDLLVNHGTVEMGSYQELRLIPQP